MSRHIVKSFFPILCRLYQSYNCAEQTGCPFFWQNLPDSKSAVVSIFEWSGTVSYTTHKETIKFPSPECRKLAEIFVKNLDDRQMSEMMKYYLSSLMSDTYEFDVFTDTLQNIRRLIITSSESYFYLKSVNSHKPQVLILKYVSKEIGSVRNTVQYMFSNNLQSDTALKYAKHVYENEPKNILDYFLSLDSLWSVPDIKHSYN